MKPQTSLRLVLQAPHSQAMEVLFKEVQTYILDKGFGRLPPRKSVLKIELVDLCFMAMPCKPKNPKKP
jgi:hypothetical protein